MTLSINQARDVALKYFERRDRFPNESEAQALVTVILNYGDHLTPVSCIGGEWSGVKGDLSHQSPHDIPVCPNGHPLMEGPIQFRLGLMHVVD